jgi:hypothetical protein
MVAVILHVANTIAVWAIWPPDDVVLRLRSGDLALHICQQLLRLGQGQPQIGDIAKAIRPTDLHEVRAWILTLGASLHQPQNPRHAPTPGLRSGVKIPSSRHPQFRGGPVSHAAPRAHPATRSAAQQFTTIGSQPLGAIPRYPLLVEHSSVAASLRARSNPDFRYHQDHLAGKFLPDRYSGGGHHRRSQSTEVPIASAFPQRLSTRPMVPAGEGGTGDLRANTAPQKRQRRAGFGLPDVRRRM